METKTKSAVSWEHIQEQLGLTIPNLQGGHSGATRQPAYGSDNTLSQLMMRKCVDGERTNHLTKLIGVLVATGYGASEVLTRCHRWNSRNDQPLDDKKIVATCESIILSDQQNHPERYRHLQQVKPLFDLQAGRIDRYFSTTPSARRWVVNDLIVLGKSGSVVAPGGYSKSQWLLQLGVSVATGALLAGHWVMGETGGVLMLCAEDDEEEIHRRLHKIKSHFVESGQTAQLKGIEERLHIFSTIGTDTLLTKREVAGEVNATTVVERIALLASEIANLKLIVIDPASRFRGGEENSNEDATRFVEALEVLAKKTNATVLIAHHTNKGSSTNSIEPGQGASRGASALTDGLRLQINFHALSDQQLKQMNISRETKNRYVAVTVTKSNYSAFPEAVILERGDGGFLNAVSAVNSLRRHEDELIGRVLQVIAKHGKPISAREIEDRYGGLDTALNIPKAKTRSIIKLAVERGLLAGGNRKSLVLTAAGLSLV